MGRYLHDILTSSPDAEHRRAIDSVYNFIKKDACTRPQISERACEDGLIGNTMAHHAAFVNYAIEVLKENKLITLNRNGFYSVK